MAYRYMDKHGVPVNDMHGVTAYDMRGKPVPYMTCMYGVGISLPGGALPVLLEYTVPYRILHSTWAAEGPCMPHACEGALTPLPSEGCMGRLLPMGIRDTCYVAMSYEPLRVGRAFIKLTSIYFDLL